MKNLSKDIEEQRAIQSTISKNEFILHLQKLHNDFSLIESNINEIVNSTVIDWKPFIKAVHKAHNDFNMLEVKLKEILVTDIDDGLVMADAIREFKDAITQLNECVEQRSKRIADLIKKIEN
jgi:hypothetical protein